MKTHEMQMLYLLRNRLGKEKDFSQSDVIQLVSLERTYQSDVQFSMQIALFSTIVLFFIIHRWLPGSLADFKTLIECCICVPVLLVLMELLDPARKYKKIIEQTVEK